MFKRERYIFIKCNKCPFMLYLDKADFILSRHLHLTTKKRTKSHLKIGIQIVFRCIMFSGNNCNLSRIKTYC